MRRSIIIFCFLTGAFTQMKTYQHHIFMARKTRSSAPTIQTGYSYTKMNDGPGTISVLKNNNENGSNSNIALKETTKTGDKQNKSMKILKNDSAESSIANKTKTISDPAPEKRDLMTSALETKPTTINEVITRYDRNNNYRVDDDDLRKDPNMYDGWPYFHHSPYDYEHLKYDNEGEKAKDKRFIYDIMERIIPVREDIKNDIPAPYYNPVSESTKYQPEYQSDANVDNPMYGNQPFFSSVLSDYFDMNDEEDPLTFRGLNWGKEFDNRRSYYSDIDDNNKRVRRLQKDDTVQKPQRNKQYYQKRNYGTDEHSAFKEKGFNRNKQDEEEGLGGKIKEDHENNYRHGSDNYRGFKDFVDSFVNKFGSEGHNKDTNYKVNRTQDKGEKKKGFRRVYHKDEYNEDNEFYDNTNNKSTLTQNIGSKHNIGGSEAILRSQAAAAIGNEGNSVNHAGNKKNQSYFNRNKDRYKSNGHDEDFHRYKDIAKMAAIQNNADYFDPF